MDKNYINGQGLEPYKNMKYMMSNIGKAGCGPIAAYNILQALGEEESLEDIIEYFSKHKLFNMGGFIGTNFFCIAKFFKSRKLRIGIRFLPRIKNAEKIIRQGNPAVLMYFHGKGSHFVAIEYNKYGDGSFCVYNKSNKMPVEFVCKSLWDIKGKRKIFIPMFLMSVKK